MSPPGIMSPSCFFNVLVCALIVFNSSSVLTDFNDKLGHHFKSAVKCLSPSTSAHLVPYSLARTSVNWRFAIALYPITFINMKLNLDYKNPKDYLLVELFKQVP